jgi:outer membrane receptor protein involved in Fe transport
MQGEQRAITDERGAFRLLALPPGSYRVVARFDGFHTLEQAEVRVPLDGGVVLDLGLVPAFSETISVPGRPPVIDAASSARGTELPRETFEVLPSARSTGIALSPSTEGAITLGALAPGVVPGRTGSPRIAGLGINATRYIVDGLDISDPNRGGAGLGFPFELVDEVEVKTGGYGAEYGGALAGVINILTRAGGNQHHGDVFGYYRDQQRQAGEFGGSHGFREVDYGVDAGGRIVRDRLWYFAAFNPQSVETENISLQGASLTDRLDGERFAGKLTWQAAASHRLNLSVLGKEADQKFHNLAAVGQQGHHRVRLGRSLSLNWDGIFGSNFLVEAVAGRFAVDEDMHTLDDSAPAYLDLTPPGHWAAQQACGDVSDLPAAGEIWFTPSCVGGDTIQAPLDTVRDQLRGSANWLVGRHELEVGASVSEQELEMGARLPGPFAAPLIDEDGVEVDPDGVAGAVFHLDAEGYYVLQEFVAVGTPWAKEHAVFFQDRLQPSSHVTLDLGVRAESYRNRVRETGGDEHELDFGLGEMIAPRLGVAWDFRGDGRSRLFGQLGRYYESMPLAASLIAFGPTRDVYHTFEYPADGSLPAFSNLGAYFYSDLFITEPMPVVPGIEPTHTDEASVGVEYELRRGLAVGLSAVYRDLRDVIETESFDQAFVVGNPGGHHAVHPVSGEELAEPVDYDDPVHRYQALELTVMRPLRDRWQFFASYVYSECEGNYTGLEFDAHATPQFDFPALMDGAYGPLPCDQPHQLKGYGSYGFPFGLTVGLVGQSYSGTPISKLGFWPNLYDRFVETRGSSGRTPTTAWADLRLAYGLPLRGRDLTLELVFEALNLTDEQEVMGVDELWTFAEGEGLNPGECGGADPACVNEDGESIGNANWGQPTVFQFGRTLRFGLKLRW